MLETQLTLIMELQEMHDAMIAMINSETYAKKKMMSISKELDAIIVSL